MTGGSAPTSGFDLAQWTRLPPARLARVAGLLYLVIIVGAGFAEGAVRGTLVVPGDAAATAANLRASETLYRLGFLTDLIAFLADVALAVLFYVLLAPAGRLLSLVAAAFRLAQASVLGLNMLHHFGALFLIGSAAYLSAFTPEQLDALVLLSAEAHEHGYLIAQMFFGVHCGLLGVLMVRSPAFPSALGVLVSVVGVGYLADGTTFFLAPGVAPSVSPFYLTPVVVGELALCGWLLVKGVREPDPPHD